MKTLERIDTPVEGSIIRADNGYEFAADKVFRGTDFYYVITSHESYQVPLDTKPIGYINITHEIIDGKLVKIPRGDIAVGDVWINDSSEALYISNFEYGEAEMISHDGDVQSVKDLNSITELEIQLNSWGFKRVGIATQPIQWIKTEG